MTDAKTIIEKFGFTVEEEPTRIYAFSPVYKVEDVVIKRTQSPLQKAERLLNFTVSLKESGVNVVTPVALATDNPKQLGEDCYVAYRFIHGATYSGALEEIRQAGELLGRIHALSSSHNCFHLPEYEVFDFYPQEVRDSMKKISEFVETFQADIETNQLEAGLLRAVGNQEALQGAGLTFVASPHDYKANNLVYEDTPVLIDPDNGTWVPQLFDLALSLLLFHNELASAPDRVFTAHEWQTFLDGYYTFAVISEENKIWWKEAIMHVFLDEVMWLMAEVEEDWQRPEQVRLFESLVNIFSDPTSYAL